MQHSHYTFFYYCKFIYAIICFHIHYTNNFIFIHYKSFLFINISYNF